MKSEQVAGFVSESMAGFIGIRNSINQSIPFLRIKWLLCRGVNNAFAWQ